MGKSKGLRVIVRTRITTLYDDSYSVRMIVKKLKLPRNTVHEKQSMRIMSKRNKRLTAQEIKADFNSGHLKGISLYNVKTKLRSANLYCLGQQEILKLINTMSI